MNLVFRLGGLIRKSAQINRPSYYKKDLTIGPEHDII